MKAGLFTCCSKGRAGEGTATHATRPTLRQPVVLVSPGPIVIMFRALGATGLLGRQDRD
jgi:hypothetical protein